MEKTLSASPKITFTKKHLSSSLFFLLSTILLYLAYSLITSSILVFSYIPFPFFFTLALIKTITIKNCKKNRNALLILSSFLAAALFKIVDIAKIFLPFQNTTNHTINISLDILFQALLIFIAPFIILPLQTILAILAVKIYKKVKNKNIYILLIGIFCIFSTTVQFFFYGAPWQTGKAYLQTKNYIANTYNNQLKITNVQYLGNTTGCLASVTEKAENKNKTDFLIMPNNTIYDGYAQLLNENEEYTNSQNILTHLENTLPTIWQANSSSVMPNLRIQTFIPAKPQPSTLNMASLCVTFPNTVASEEEFTQNIALTTQQLQQIATNYNYNNIIWRAIIQGSNTHNVYVQAVQNGVAQPTQILTYKGDPLHDPAFSIAEQLHLDSSLFTQYETSPYLSFL